MLQSEVLSVKRIIFEGTGEGRRKIIAEPTE